jgi:phytoene dehydrogenase-like protein
VTNEPERKSFEIVVIGAGLGGLSAAGFLARAGLRVLLVERSDGAGGCVRAVQHDGYSLDPGVCSIARGVEDELRDGLLAHLGAREHCVLLPVVPAYRAVLPGLSVNATCEAYEEAFPGERDAIRGFFRVCNRILEDTHRLPLQLPLDELDRILDTFPTFVRYRSATLAQALDEHFHDARLKAAIAISWPWAGLPPSGLSFTTFAQGLALLTRGTYAVAGSFQRLVDALVAGFEANGGEIVLGAEAVRILVEEGTVSGLLLADGRELAASAVVSNADARRTLESMLGREHLPQRLRTRLGRMRPSLSGFVLFVETEFDVAAAGAALENFLGTDGVWASVPTLVDSSLAPPGRHIVVIRALASEGDADGSRHLLEAAEQALPGFRESSTVLAALTPADLAARTGNAGGALYGWENTPANIGSRRLPVVGPVRGLYLAGHWSQPGHGVYRALLSGMHAASAVLADRGLPDAIPDFRTTANQ